MTNKQSLIIVNYECSGYLQDLVLRQYSMEIRCLAVDVMASELSELFPLCID